MEDISLHLLDVAQNSIAAGASKIDIAIEENPDIDIFTLTVTDNGSGMDGVAARKVHDPFFTTRPGKKVGLGVSLLAQSVREANGSFSIRSERGKGTTVTAEFQASHIDMKPLGDIGATMQVLIGGHPLIEFSFSYRKGDFQYKFSTGTLRKRLDGVPLQAPGVLQLIKDDITTALRQGRDGTAA